MLRNQKKPKEARAYRIKHNYDLGDLITTYQWILQLAINHVWENISWVKKEILNYYTIPNSRKSVKLLKLQGKRFRILGKKILVFYKAERLIPRIPKSAEFVREMRNYLMSIWRRTPYATHYVDSAIRTAYWILESWRTNYLHGKFGGNKPVIKKRFARIKNTLFRVRDGELILTVIPKQKYLRFSIRNTWFYNRIKSWKLGEIILKDHEVILMFTKEKEEIETKGAIGWDMNIFSMDGFGDDGYIQISLKELFRIHIVYHNRRREIQRLLKTNPKLAIRLLRKLSIRERDKIRDLIHKLTTDIARRYSNCLHVFEDLEKESYIIGEGNIIELSLSMIGELSLKS